MKHVRQAWLISALISACGAAAAEDTRKTLDLDVAAQPLATSLRDVAEAFDFTIAFYSDSTDGMEAPALSGTFTPVEALDALLADTRLEYTYVNDTSVAVRPKSTTIGEAVSGKSRPASSPVPMAQNNAPAIQSPNQKDSNGGDDEKEALPIEEIVVTGSNIRGIGTVGALSMTFTQDELAKTGYSTLGELFASLPQNLNEISPAGGMAEGRSEIASSNSQRATGISLRGLGPGSTLVLLNGKRRPGSVRGRVFDVSAIPLSMVERIEVLTGGRSGIYGSDAVAGVVNIVTVRELDGAESQVYYGGSPAGGERFNFSQTLGRAFDDGGFVLGYVYRKDWPLDATATGILRAPSSEGLSPIPGLFYLQHPSEQHVGLFSGQYALDQNAELYADAHFSSDTTEPLVAYNLLGLLDLGTAIVIESDQYSAVGGVRLDAGEDWQIDLSALYGVVDDTVERAIFRFPPGSLTSLDVAPDSISVNDSKSTLTSFSAIADGPVGKLWNATVSAAVGVDFRNEGYERTRTSPPASPTPEENIERDIWSAYFEMHLPLIDDDGQRLELSLAGRYDHYSDVGGTFNPQFGLEWTPVGWLTFRGSYATAFRAPYLYAQAFGTSVFVTIVNDPLAADGSATQLTHFGGNPDLQPEEADTWTVGVDWQPSEGTKLSLSCFRIDYRDRVGVPSDFYPSALQEEMFYRGLIDRNPSPEELDEILDRQGFFFNGTTTPFDPETDDPLVAFPDIVLFDNRRNNIGLETIDGLDVQASAVLEAPFGDWSFGLNGTYYFDYVRNITVASPPISRLNEPGKLVDLRLRGRVGWSEAA